MNNRAQAAPAIEATDLKVVPENTPIFIGVGVLNEGKITLKNTDPSKNFRVVIAGEHVGDIQAPCDVVQVINGGSLKPSEKITCRHLVVAGRLIAPGAEIHAEKVTLLATAILAVGEVHTQEMEQTLGCYLNAHVVMPAPAEADIQSAFDATPTGHEAGQTHGAVDSQASDQATHSQFTDQQEQVGAASITIVSPE